MGRLIGEYLQKASTMKKGLIFSLLSLPALYMVVPTLVSADAIVGGGWWRRCVEGCVYSEIRQRCVCHGRQSSTDFLLRFKTDEYDDYDDYYDYEYDDYDDRKEEKIMKAQEVKTEDTAGAEKSVSE